VEFNHKKIGHSGDYPFTITFLEAIELFRIGMIGTWNSGSTSPKTVPDFTGILTSTSLHPYKFHPTIEPDPVNLIYDRYCACSSSSSTLIIGIPRMFFKPKQEKFFLVLSDAPAKMAPESTAPEPTPIASEPPQSKAPAVDPPASKPVPAPIQPAIQPSAPKPIAPAAPLPPEPPYIFFPSRRRPGPSLSPFTRMVREMNRP